MVLSASMLGLIIWAVLAARSGNVPAHRSAMLRAYAIGQGASTQTFLGIGWIALMGAEPVGLWRDVVMASAWCINLLIAEVVIGRAFVSRVAAFR